MRNPGSFLLCLFLLTPYLSWCQGAKPVMDYSKIDSFARTVKYHGDIYELTKTLTAAYPEKLAKTRAIFIWITEHITYDYKFINKGKSVKVPACNNSANCEAMLQDWENKYLDKVLRKKRAICSGYSRLFRRMCAIAGIRAEVVSGYTKSQYYQAGSAGSLNHAWNAVWLDSTYYLLDATWAAGGCDKTENGKLYPFQKGYDDYYWLTSFHDLARNHYPEEKKWVFENNYTKEKFANNPFYDGGILPHIQLLSPATGVIHPRKGDTIHITFRYFKGIDKIQINTNIVRNLTVYQEVKKSRRRIVREIDSFALSKQRYIDYQQNGFLYSFDYIVTDPFLNYLDILFDYRRALRFKVMVEKD
jgi:Transglutaminase-like superfamily